MKKIILSIIIFSVSVMSALAGAIYTKNIYVSESKISEEESRLQGLAFTQLLLEHLDKNNVDELRREVIDSFNSYAYVSDPLERYSFMRIEACKMHKLIYKYREFNANLYRAEKPEDKRVKSILEAWDKVECEQDA